MNRSTRLKCFVMVVVTCLFMSGCELFKSHKPVDTGTNNGPAPSQIVTTHTDNINKFNDDSLIKLDKQKQTLNQTGESLVKLGQDVAGLPVQESPAIVGIRKTIDTLRGLNTVALTLNSEVKTNVEQSKTAIQHIEPTLKSVKKNEQENATLREENKQLKEAPIGKWIDGIMWFGVACLGIAGVLLALSMTGIGSGGVLSRPMTVLGIVGGLALALAVALAWFAKTIATMVVIAVGVLLAVCVAVGIWWIIKLVKAKNKALEEKGVAVKAVRENVKLISEFKDDVKANGGEAVVEKWFEGKVPLAQALQSDETIEIVRKELGK